MYFLDNLPHARLVSRLQSAEVGSFGGRVDGGQGKIVTAIAKAVAEYGYTELTLDQVLGHAGVTREEFEPHFQSLEQGLIAAQDDFVERLRLEMAAACDLGRAWRGPALTMSGPGPGAGTGSTISS